MNRSPFSQISDLKQGWSGSALADTYTHRITDLVGTARKIIWGSHNVKVKTILHAKKTKWKFHIKDNTNFFQCNAQIKISCLVMPWVVKAR